MKIDLDLYKVGKKKAQEWYLYNKGHYSVGEAISLLAHSTHCPNIVVAYWVGELTDWHPDAVACIIRMKEFYHYETVDNRPEGSPV